MRRHYRRNARPNENEIPTVRIARRTSYRRNMPITPSQAGVLYDVLAAHGYVSNPRRRRVLKRRVLKSRIKKHRRTAKRLPKPPKGKRAGSYFKRNGKWFRVTLVKARKGRRVIRRRVVRKTTARAAHKARK